MDGLSPVDAAGSSRPAGMACVDVRAGPGPGKVTAMLWRPAASGSPRGLPMTAPLIECETECEIERECLYCRLACAIEALRAALSSGA